MTLKLDIIKNHLCDDWPFEYQEHFSKFPKKLYRYVPPNDYYFDSIEKNYIYLCPAKELDDQFECRVDFPVDKILANKSIVDDKLVKALVDMISEYPSNFNKNDMKKMTLSCISKDKTLDLGKVSLELNKPEYNITEKDQAEILKVFSALMSGAWISEKGEEQFKNLIKKAYKAQDDIGIGSLSENGKSQVMWEMYGKHYSGMMIEYELSDDVNSIINTFPVVYGDKRKTNLLLILINICLDSFVISLSQGKMGDMNSTKDYIKLFLTKYNEWAFQKEWRIVGEAGIRFPIPKIKKVYLGKRMIKEDKKRIYDIAKKNNIELYQQLDNYESLEIKYEKLI